jgi:hypothetical protein
LFFGIFGYLGAFLRHDFGLGYTAIGFILAGFGLGGVVYCMLVKVLVRRLGKGGPGGGWRRDADGVLHRSHSRRLAGVWVAMTVLGLAYYMLHNTLDTRYGNGTGSTWLCRFDLAFVCFWDKLGVSAVGIGVSMPVTAP